MDQRWMISGIKLEFLFVLFCFLSNWRANSGISTRSINGNFCWVIKRWDSRVTLYENVGKGFLDASSDCCHEDMDFSMHIKTVQERINFVHINHPRRQAVTLPKHNDMQRWLWNCIWWLAYQRHRLLLPYDANRQFTADIFVREWLVWI